LNKVVKKLTFRSLAGPPGDTLDPGGASTQNLQLGKAISLVGVVPGAGTEPRKQGWGGRGTTLRKKPRKTINTYNTETKKKHGGQTRKG